VLNEISYDKHHENRDRAYRVLQQHFDVGGNIFLPTTPYKLAPTLKEDFPEIEKFARVSSSFEDAFVKKGNEFIKEGAVHYADPEIFDILTIPLSKGNPKTALSDPHSVIISEKVAKKYFGNQNPMGEALTISIGSDVENFKITGVLKETNFRSHFEPNFIIPISYMISNMDPNVIENWMSSDCVTYILLEDNCKVSEIEAKLEDFAKRHLPENVRSKFYIQSLNDIYLHSEHVSFDIITKHGNINYVYSFSAIAILILFIACINYILLSAARSTTRAKEIGIRKVVGADRSDVTKQVLSESLCFSFISLPIALVLVELFLPHLNQLLELNLSTNFLNSWEIILGFLLITVIVGILSGSYIAFYSSSFQPVDILRNRFNIGKPKSNLRRCLTIFQVMIFLILIFCSLTINRQMRYIQNKELGFNKEQILIIQSIRSGNFGQRYISFKNELLQSPYIVNVSGSNFAPPREEGIFSSYILTTHKKIKTEIILTDQDYLTTLGIELIEGRNFSDEFPSDYKDAIILNQAAVKQLELGNPIGENIKIRGWDDRKIIGVIKDAHFHSLYEEVTPTIIMLNKPWAYHVLLVRLKSGDIRNTINFIERKWYEFFPSSPFDHSFMDENFEQAYKADMNLGKLIGYFTFLAIFVACVGQFGLILFTTERRTKEIGIRKVLGASVSNIVIMLIKEFIILIIIASIIAYPFAHYAINKWLQNFAYRIDAGLATFLVSVVMALIVTLITVGSQAVRAARATPVESLRYE
jgi:putative ABC transport system permease protein